MAGDRRDLVWAPRARRDLIDIWTYFAKEASPAVAGELLRAIAKAASRLQEHPHLGRSRDDIAAGLRSLLVHPHPIVYRVTDARVDIARILHERRDIAAILAKDRKP